MRFEWNYFTRPEFVIGVVLVGLLLTIVGNLLSKRLESLLAWLSAKKRATLEAESSLFRQMVEVFKKEPDKRVTAQLYSLAMLQRAHSAVHSAFLMAFVVIGLQTWRFYSPGHLLRSLLLLLAVIVILLSLYAAREGFRSIDKALTINSAVMEAANPFPDAPPRASR